MACSSGVGFNPQVDGTRYTFEVAGLYNGLFVMQDRQTGSVWTHYDGQVLTGSLADAGLQLPMQPIVHTTWQEWLEGHPDTTVLDWYPEFERRYREIDPGRGGLGPQFQATVLNWDDRLPENELVLGVNAGSEFRAYVLSDFAPGLQVVSEELDGIRLVVFIDSASHYGLAFEARVGEEQLAIEAQGEQIVDKTGSVWDLSGVAISGPYAGQSLLFVTSFVTEWYGWAAYHPATSIYGR